MVVLATEPHEHFGRLNFHPAILRERVGHPLGLGVHIFASSIHNFSRLKNLPDRNMQLSLPDFMTFQRFIPMNPVEDNCMRSEKVELRLPHAVIEEGTRRAEEESYRNFQRYILALIVDDVMHPRHHCTLAHTIANADPQLQDQLLDTFLKISREALSKMVIQSAKNKPTRKP